MPRLFRCLLLIFLLPVIAAAQPDSLQEIKGLHSKQIYDLMVDSRGFLWIGYDQGLARYDGTSFTRFTCPEQNSLGLGDITEDPQGRIWCRNFSSQIFYVEKEKMNLLTAYDSKVEIYFPRIIVIGDKLVASSAKGLFVCHTSTMTSSYISTGGIGTTSLSLVGDQVIAYGNPAWFVYDPRTGGALKRLDTVPGIEKNELISLEPHAGIDTFFSYSRYKGTVTKLVLKDNRVCFAGRVTHAGFIYTINPYGRETWIHTRDRSFTLDGTKSLDGLELTDMIIDKEGNTWYSSFKYGLLVRYKSHWKSLPRRGLQEGDFITRAESRGPFSIYGTNAGRIILEDNRTGQTIRTFSLPTNLGSVQYLHFVSDDLVMIGTGIQVFMLHNNLRKLEQVSLNLSLKSAVLVDSSLYLATATHFCELPVRLLTESVVPDNLTVIKADRCRWVEYNATTSTLLVAFKDGLTEVRDKKVIPLLYKGAPVRAITMHAYGNKFFIATNNDGMLVLDSSGFRKLNIQDKYRDNPVNTITEFNGAIWLLANDFIIRFNPDTEQRYQDLIIPPFPNADIYAVAPDRGETVLLTSKGRYALRTGKPDAGYALKNYLMNLLVNGKKTEGKQPLVLPHDQNSLEFFLSVPFYTTPDKIYFNYRLQGSHDESWQQSENGVNEFRFLSLSPGKYTFEALAVHSQFGPAAAPILFHFTIRPAWNQTTAFRIGRILLITGFMAFFIILFFRARIRRQKNEFEKQLLIRNERQRISAEIHDDIGAGLSGVRLLTELTRRRVSDEAVKEDLDKIYDSVTELSGKVKDVVWSLNTGNDTLVQLLQYLQQQAKQLLQNTSIILNSTHPEELPDLQLGSEKRTDLYLLVKEALHNALKHSGATTVGLHFRIREGRLIITISDDGKGLHPAYKKGNGMFNMKKRIERLNGTMILHNNDGLTLEFFVPLN